MKIKKVVKALDNVTASMAEVHDALKRLLVSPISDKTHKKLVRKTTKLLRQSEKFSKAVSRVAGEVA